MQMPIGPPPAPLAEALQHMFNIFQYSAKALLPLSTTYAKDLRYMSKKIYDHCKSSQALLMQAPTSPLTSSPLPAPQIFQNWADISKYFNTPAKVVRSSSIPFLAKALQYVSKIFHDPCKSCLSLLMQKPTDSPPTRCFKRPPVYVYNISIPLQKPSGFPPPLSLQKLSYICLEFFMIQAKAHQPTFSLLSCKSPLTYI